MEVLKSYLSQIRIPNDNDNIYKEECVYSFDTPESEGGLYVSLNTFLGFGNDHVENYFKKTGKAVFLHLRRNKKPIVVDKIGEGPEKKVTRLAIGVEGGFDADTGIKYEYEDTYSIVVFPNHITIEYPNEGLPTQVTDCVQGIINAESALTKILKESLAGTWDGEIRQVSKYATDLVQLDNGVKIPPFGWKCEKCDLTNNLWLNLTDGSILCGRKFFDGSGGNDHAVIHYKESGHPLAVKLGTITSEGKGDVFSYAEDEMVENPHLKKHLTHFGINIGQMEKTEKSMVELELEMNQKYGEWGILTESSSNLIPVCGPGLTGMKNLGNSCYLNSVMQVMFTVPDFVKKYVENGAEIFAQFPNDPANDFNIQMAKLGCGLYSHKYSSITEDKLDQNSGISPAMFKNLIGKNHPDFSTKLQQDAQEFFLHLVNTLDRNTRHQLNPADALKFNVEDRVECCSSGKVKYTYRDEWCLPLPIPLHLATNIDEVEKYEALTAEAEKTGIRLDPEALVRPKISLASCLETFAKTEIVEHFYSTAIGAKTSAKKNTRLATMPDFLMLHLKKFTLREDWVSIKLDVSVDIPDLLDLSMLRGKGMLASEEPLPELVGKGPSPPPVDPIILNQLVEMGFPLEACKRSMFFTNNTGLESATQWIMEHITDSDFGDPFVPPGTDIKNTTFIADPNGLEMLMGMGFSEIQATRALKETNNNTERAVDWIFSHSDELETIESSMFEEQANEKKGYRDGGNKYKLVGIISHMGTSSQVGHYVCHILKNDQWIIFNDEKVAVSQNPPKDLGYLYLYQRL